MLRRIAPLLSVLLCATTAAAQLKLPGARPVASDGRSGDLAPHYLCLACQGKNYVLVSNPRLDADGNTITWCDACKKDTSQRLVTAAPAPGETRPGGGDPRLKVPKSGTQPPAPAAKDPAAPAADAPPPAVEAPATPPNDDSPAAKFVFDTLRTARGEQESLVSHAAESLVALGEGGLTAARREVASDDPRVFAASARALVRAGRAGDLELVRARLLGRTPTSAPALVGLLAARDPVIAGPAFLAELLDHPQAPIRQAAEKELRTVRADERAKFVEPRLASKRPETRLAAVSLLADSREPAVTDALLPRLSDPSPRVASAVAQSLALRQDDALDARLVAAAFKSRWVLRTESYALLAIVEREDVHLRPMLDATHVEPLLGGLDSSDPFVRGACAAALAGIGFRSTDATATAWLDRDVVDRLIDAVSGRVFFDDYSSLAPVALRRLKLVSGEDLGNDGPRWVEWWMGVRGTFWARRAAISIAPEEIPSFALRLETSGSAPEHFTLVGPAIAEASVQQGTSGDVVFLSLDETRSLVDLVRGEGLFGAELLPGARGGSGRGERTLGVGVGGRAKSFKFGPGVTEPWFERVVALARELRDRNRWQRFAPAGSSALALWRDEGPWWRVERTPLERAQRMKALVFRALEGGSPALRDLGANELERLAETEGGLEAADFTPLLKLVEAETHAGERSRKLVKLALRAAVAAGRDGVPPAALCDDLLKAIARRFAERGGAEIEMVLQAGGAEFARGHQGDERPLVRAAVARVLAADPTSENLAVLQVLVNDRDESVEIATVTALGEHEVAGARTEILVRARLALPPVRAAALIAAGKLGGEYVLDALVLGLNDRERSVRLAAAKGLAELGEPAATSVLVGLLADESDADIYGAAREGLAELGERAVPDLVRLVHSPLARGRREAALLLSEQGSHEAASALMSILSTSPNDARVATELAILTCIDHRGAEDPAQAWWTWWDGVRHDDALAWFRAGVERLGIPTPGPGALEGAGTPQGRSFLLVVMERPEPWLAERARREFVRITGTQTGALPARGPERDTWLRGLRSKLEERRF